MQFIDTTISRRFPRDNSRTNRIAAIPQLIRHGGVIGNDGAAVPHGSEVLGGIEAKSRQIAQAAPAARCDWPSASAQSSITATGRDANASRVPATSASIPYR